MTVETQTKKVNLPSSASTFTYSFSPIVIYASSDIVVTITNDTTGVETVLSEGTTSSTYTVVVSSFPGTGSITYPGDSGTEAGTGSTINIKRVLTLEQTTDFENQGGYFPDTLEEALDKGVMRDLQQQEEIDRSFQAATSETDLTTLKLPNTSTVTGAANLGVSSDHTALEFNVSAGTLPDPVTVVRGGTGSTSAADARSALGVQADLDVPSQSEAEAGTATTERVWTAQRVSQAVTALVSGVPSGTIVDYAGTTEPSGWVFCDGAAYNSTSDTTFSDLYAAISNVYGGSDGTNFQVPDMRGRVGVGQDDMGGSSANRIVETEAHGVNGDTLGAVGGVGQHAMSTAEMPSHTHTLTGTGGFYRTTGSPGSPIGGGGASFITTTINSTGGGGAHTNLQPSLIINKIIKK